MNDKLSRVPESEKSEKIVNDVDFYRLRELIKNEIGVQLSARNAQLSKIAIKASKIWKEFRVVGSFNGKNTPIAFEVKYKMKGDKLINENPFLTLVNQSDESKRGVVSDYVEVFDDFFKVQGICFLLASYLGISGEGVSAEIVRGGLKVKSLPKRR